MNRNKIITLIGFAYKSRKMVSGEGITLENIKKNKIKLVILASDASQNTSKRIRDKSQFRNIQVMDCFNRFELGKAIGQNERVVLGITDSDFANSIIENYGGEACAENQSIFNG